MSLATIRKIEGLRKLRTQALARKKAAQRSTEQTPAKIEDHWQPWPAPNPQRDFFYSTCREILYGGAAGGGKSQAITALPLRWAHLPGFNAVVFRRETVDLPDLIEKSETLVPQVFPGLSPVHSPFFKWTFPSGARLHYRHLQKETSYKTFDGWAINLLIFDELTHFTEKQYKYLKARVRTADPNLPTLIRATTNPGGPGHEWVFKHWGAWLDPEFEAEGLPKRTDEAGEPLPPALPGEVWWIRTEKGRETYYREEPPEEEGRPVALSRTFIPARVEDNPAIMQDKAYLAELEGLDDVRREQLRRGDWLIKPTAKSYFDRAWVEFVDAAPVAGVLARIRAWDFAGTAKEKRNDPDWTAGVLLAFTREAIYIEDVARFRGGPGDVKAKVLSTAEMDGRRTVVFIPQDPGQAGKSQVFDYMTALRGFPLITRPVTGDKIIRFRPFSSYANPRIAGGKRVHMVRGAWNADYLTELEDFPDGTKDDQVDATSDAFTTLSELLAKQRKGGSRLIAVNTSER